MAKSKRKKTTTHAAQSKDTATLLQEMRAALRRGGLDRAIALANSALEQSDNDQEQQGIKQYLAECYFRQAVEQEGDERIASLSKALRYNPDDGRTYFYRAMAYWQAFRVDKAHKDFKKAQQLEPQRPHIHYLVMLADMLANKASSTDTKLLSEAESNSIALLQTLRSGEKPSEIPEPVLGEAALWQSLLQMYLEPDAQPREVLQAQLEAKPSEALRPWLRYMLLLCSLRADDIAASEQQLKALALYKNLPAVLQTSLATHSTQLLQRLAQAGHWQTVERLLALPWLAQESSIASLVPIYDHLAYRAAQESRWEVACKYWQQVAAHAPTRYTAQNLALAYERLENWQAAAQAWREMLRRRPRKDNHPDYLSSSQVSALWRQAGNCYRHFADKLSQALHDDDGEAFDFLGDDEVMYPEDARSEAISCYRKALQYADADYGKEVQLELVKLLCDNNQMTAAENELDRLIDAHPDYVPARILRAAIVREHHEYKIGQSVEDLEHALQLEPDNDEAREQLVESYLRYNASIMKNDNDALAHLDDCLATVGDHPMLLRVRNDIAIQQYADPPDHKDALLPNVQRFCEAAFNQPLQSRRDFHLQAAMSQLVYIEADEEADMLTERLRQGYVHEAFFWLVLAEDCLESLTEGIDRRKDMFALLALGLRKPDRRRDGNDPQVVKWGRCFLDEAIAQAGSDKQQSLAYVLASAYNIAHNCESTMLLEHYFARIKAEVPESGAKEFALAYEAIGNKEKSRTIKRHLQAAKRKAQASDEPALLELIQALEAKVTAPNLYGMFDFFGKQFNL